MSNQSDIKQALQMVCDSLRLTFLRDVHDDEMKLLLNSYPEPLAFMVACLDKELESLQARRTQRRLQQAHFPYVKTMESFDFTQAPLLPEVKLRELITSQFITAAEPVLFLGEPGTGKTHLAIAIGHAAVVHGYSVRFTTLARLANELMEAKDAKVLSTLINRYAKPDVLIIDELGYVPLKKAHAELIFQVLSARQEHRPVIITTNLPFSEWTNIFTEPRLCKAIIDRVIHKAHIIETGDQSIRLAAQQQADRKETV